MSRGGGRGLLGGISPSKAHVAREQDGRDVCSVTRGGRRARRARSACFACCRPSVSTCDGCRISWPAPATLARNQCSRTGEKDGQEESEQASSCDVLSFSPARRHGGSINYCEPHEPVSRVMGIKGGCRSSVRRYAQSMHSPCPVALTSACKRERLWHGEYNNDQEGDPLFALAIQEYPRCY